MRSMASYSSTYLAVAFASTRSTWDKLLGRLGDAAAPPAAVAHAGTCDQTWARMASRCASSAAHAPGAGASSRPAAHERTRPASTTLSARAARRTGLAHTPSPAMSSLEAPATSATRRCACTHAPCAALAGAPRSPGGPLKAPKSPARTKSGRTCAKVSRSSSGPWVRAKNQYQLTVVATGGRRRESRRTRHPRRDNGPRRVASWGPRAAMSLMQWYSKKTLRSPQVQGATPFLASEMTRAGFTQ
mmetsp:Transcript_30421/g.81815  ORF Transcript_30421/g.81815 Transcript_30421/m.81815 type:complete len:245 (-) Transcript_30421:321-1055(-)